MYYSYFFYRPLLILTTKLRALNSGKSIGHGRKNTRNMYHHILLYHDRGKKSGRPRYLAYCETDLCVLKNKGTPGKRSPEESSQAPSPTHRVMPPAPTPPLKSLMSSFRSRMGTLHCGSCLSCLSCIAFISWLFP